MSKLQSKLNLLARVITRLGRLAAPPSPAEVVKANTKEAFDYFYRQDEYINRQYLEPSRMELYALVAEYCFDLFCHRPLPVEETLRVVDIGCGTGHMLKALETVFRSGFTVELYGLDFAESAVQIAKRVLPSANVVVGDIYDNDLTSDYFDLVLSIETFEHLSLPHRALERIERLCKPGGNLVFTVPNGEKDTWNGHVNFWTKPQFEQLLSPYGTVTSRFLQDDTVIIARLAK